MKVILAINAGSSSVKVSAFSAEGPRARPRLIAEAEVSKLTTPPPRLKHQCHGGRPTVADARVDDVEVHSQEDAFQLLLQTLVGDAALPEIASADDIAVACHRIVHGGSYGEARLLTGDTIDHLRELSELAPLHNGPALEIVEACRRRLLPAAANVACFDTQFHASLPRHIATYAIDPKRAAQNGLRKYGFHGLSYAFIARATADFLRAPPEQLNVIALHLGSGASACAIKRGRSWDTSMGLTPLAGLPGATRSGSVDPSLVFHYASDVGKLAPQSTSELHISRAEAILNQESGWRALTGTADFDVIARPDAPAEHRLAFDLFVDRVCGFVGAYYVALQGRVDALVFAGGVGERCAPFRAAVVEQAACLGFTLDEARNASAGAEDGGDSGDGAATTAVVRDISGPGARHRVLICRTDEQLEMANLCVAKTELWT